MKRLPFGTSAAPTILQLCIETVLVDLPGVRAYLDDIIVNGATPEEHAQRLDSLLLRVSKEPVCGCKKRRFGVPEATYLKHRIGARVHATDDKLKAVK